MSIKVDIQECELPILLCNWTHIKPDTIVNFIAILLLGRTAHVRKLQEGSETQDPNYTDAQINKAISRVSFPGVASNDNKIIHRDGWLFQFISWIVSLEGFPPDALVGAPQSRPADKGFDGLIIKMGVSTIEYIIICEDKATENPRSTVTEDVWPEFTDYEMGDRDNELTADMTTLLRQQNELDPDKLTRASDWFKEKRYRASVTTSKKNLPPKVHTFAGYEDVIGGHNGRRLANLFVHEDMRAYFNELSDQVADKLESMRPASHV